MHKNISLLPDLCIGILICLMHFVVLFGEKHFETTLNLDSLKLTTVLKHEHLGHSKTGANLAF